jgi:hypothetical protein
MKVNGSNGHHGRPFFEALVVGGSGAAALTLAHEAVRQLAPGAPRLDRLGMTALERLLRALHVSPPRGDRLRAAALLGDLGANALYYAPLAFGRRLTYTRGLLLGAAAGLGAVYLSPLLGLPRRHRGKTFAAKATTVGLYTLGGLAAAAVASVLHGAGAARAPERQRLPEELPR